MILRQLFILTFIAMIWSVRFSTVSAGQQTICWTPIDDETTACDQMMERAVFIDVPRRDLLSVVKSFPASSSRTTHNSREVGRTQQEARRNFWKAWVLYKEDPDSSIVLSRKALEMCDSVKYPYDHLRFSVMKADLLRSHGHLAEAYAIYRDKLLLLSHFSDPLWMGKIHVAIGALMQELEEYHEAMRHFTEGQRYFKVAGSEACEIKNRINIANLHFLLGQKSEALNRLESLEDNPFVKADSIYLANLLVSKFRISDCQDINALNRAYNISCQLNNDNLSELTMKTMGMWHTLNNNFREGRRFFSGSLEIAERLEDSSNLREIILGLEECCRALGLDEEAGMYHERWKNLEDSLYSHDRNDRIRRTEHLATINQYERRLAEESQAAAWRLTLTLWIGCFLLVILGLLLWLMWLWRRRAETERRLKSEENERLTLLNRQYSLEIEAKERELTSTTLLMAQKNTQLKDLARQLEEMEKSGEETLQTDPIKQTISRQLTADDDWRYFKLRFDKVHPGFFELMKSRYPALSKTELRLCAYIRVGMTAKEIAQVLSVKPDTVNTSRYRIRKKLRLPQDVSLEAAIEEIGV